MITYTWKGRRYNVNTRTYSNYQELHPIYGDKCSIKHTMPDDERYYKESFNGTLKFVRDDYTWVVATDNGVTRFDTIYELELWTQTQQVTTLKFVITDCEVDEDNGIVTVKPTTKTIYDDIEDCKNREFNLVDLNPEINDLTWYKRVLAQVYVGGEDIVTNLIGGMHWEQDVVADLNSVTPETLADDYHFTQREAYNEVEVQGLSSGGGNGTYFGVGDTERRVFDYLVYPVGIKPYRLRFHRWVSGNDFIFRIGIEDLNGVELYFHQENSISAYSADSATVQMQDSSTSQATAVFVSYNVKRIYDRLLCDVDTGVDRPDDDLVAYSSNYRYIAQFASFVYSYSTALSLTPTQWGTVGGSNKYYTAPSAVIEEWMPIGQSLWNNVSLFLDLNSGVTLRTEELYMRSMTLRHAYPVWSALTVLLQQVAPGVTFEPLEGYSEFLFAEVNPVTGHDNLTLFITPKSNIINGDYKTPAYKAPITLASLLEMLRNVFQLYWYIDSQGRFHLEHVSWFMNGGTYSTPTPAVSYDLTALHNTRNGKAWAFVTNRYTFNRNEIPSTITWKWMDDVTEPFIGFEMRFKSPLVNKAKNEEKNIGNYTSDIDYVSLQPNDVSQDGFMLLGAAYEAIKQFYYLPFYAYTPAGSAVVTNLQNGYLAMGYLEQQNYWLDNQPAGDIEYSNGSRAATRMQSRMKQQDVVVPMTSPIFDPITLIRTGLGDGEIQDIEINISSLTGKAKLKYDTQQ